MSVDALLVVSCNRRSWYSVGTVSATVCEAGEQVVGVKEVSVEEIRDCFLSSLSIQLVLGSVPNKTSYYERVQTQNLAFD